MVSSRQRKKETDQFEQVGYSYAVIVSEFSFFNSRRNFMRAL